jgi:hypothetical protein
MKSLCIVLILVFAAPCFSQKKSPSETIKVKVEATEWDKNLLFDKLGKHGLDHGLKFEGATEDFTYRIVFSTGQEKTQVLFGGSGGGVNTSAATVSVFDQKGTELFQVKREGRGTDAGATNAVAKEVVKRLVQLRSQIPK